MGKRKACIPCTRLRAELLRARKQRDSARRVALTATMFNASLRRRLLTLGTDGN